MTLKTISEITNAAILTCEELVNREVHTAFSSDLMSDVLAYVEEDTLLITGLVNQQVVRTAEMLDIRSILFVRGKIPSEDVLDLAKEKNMVLMSTRYPLFTTSGLLYTKGLPGIQLPE